MIPLYEDNHVIIVSKSAGEIVQGDKTGDTPLSETVKLYIKEKYAKPGAVFLGVVHRLDRPVSGVVLFARTSKALARLNEMFRTQAVQKTYWALVQNAPREPESCKSPEGSNGSMVEENEDGTVTMIFLRGEEEIERRVVSGEDYAQFEAYWEMRAKGFSGYDFNYHVYTQEMADKLESIAASYGLKLRHQRTQMFQRYGDQTDGSSREEITARINEVCAGGGRFFRVEPSGYDKFYYYDEGTFAVSFFTTENLTNAGTSCYFYNSPYDTLSSGYEFFEQVQDINSFRTRNHTTPDGTEITILQNDTDVYAYVYLESSFVTLHIVQIEGLGDAEIDAILDMVDYSTIR